AVYLSENYAFLQEPPEISSVAPSIPEPMLNEEVTVNATVTPVGGPEVRLWIRFNKEDKFQELNMFDDGNHNDGAAGDNIYGRSFIMTSLIAQYYIYAENADAGQFSPENAEHEFYTLNAIIPTAQPGDVAINEFLAKNNTDTINEYGNHEDWIELINLTDDPIDLFGLYLTDDFDNPLKYAFPENSIIQPGSYLMLWADEEDTISSFLHANFKLSADGESLMLSNGAGIVLDSLTYGAQTADISWGRCPDGSGFFDELDIPTFGYENYCPEGYPDIDLSSFNLVFAPNPFRNQIAILSADISDGFYIELYNNTGLKVFKEYIESTPGTLNLSFLSPGLYFYQVKDEFGQILSSGKILKQQ
ncbi:MAG: T9SS type A sorting domain-containing protein, partial [Bacteroidales bacterium]|nr:T9SS type A sorting domain-containing protein [Bacteroidales bacterium]